MNNNKKTQEINPATLKHLRFVSSGTPNEYLHLDDDDFELVVDDKDFICDENLKMEITQSIAQWNKWISK